MIRNKGIDQVTVEDLVEEITPKGRGAHTPTRALSAHKGGRDSIVRAAIVIGSVPESVKTEMLEKIKTFIEKAA